MVSKFFDIVEIVANFCLKIIAKLLQHKLVQKIYGRHIVWGVYLTLLFIYIAIDIVYTIGYYSSEIINPIDVTFNVLYYVGIFAISYWFRSLIKRRSDPNIGMKVATAKGGEGSLVLNKLWIPNRYWNWISFYMLWYPLISTYYMQQIIMNNNFWKFFPIIQYALILFLFLPLFSFLYIENPKSSIYSDVKNWAKNKTVAAKELISHPGVPVPVPVRSHRGRVLRTHGG